MRRETTFCDFCSKEITEETKAALPKLEQLIIRTGTVDFSGDIYTDICKPCNARMNSLLTDLAAPEVRIR